MDLREGNREKLILGIQAAVGALYFILAMRNSVKGQKPQMKKLMKKQAKRLDKLNRMEYAQAKKAIKKRKAKTF